MAAKDLDDLGLNVKFLYGLILPCQNYVLTPMMVNKAYRYELDSNKRQRSSFHRHAGVARFVYNWGLDQRIQLFKDNHGKERFTDFMKQHKLLNSLKKTQFPWMYECSKCVPQEALKDLHRAFQNFYRGRKIGKGIGFPRFKRKGQLSTLWNYQI